MKNTAPIVQPITAIDTGTVITVTPEPKSLDTYGLHGWRMKATLPSGVKVWLHRPQITAAWQVARWMPGPCH